MGPRAPDAAFSETDAIRLERVAARYRDKAQKAHRLDEARVNEVTAAHLESLAEKIRTALADTAPANDTTGA